MPCTLSSFDSTEVIILRLVTGVTRTSSHSPKIDILINNNGHACLSDFSLVMIAAGQLIDISSWIEGGTLQWMSPELLDPERFSLTKSRPTKEADCYALGMVIYEILSGQTPFSPSRPHITTFKVLEIGRAHV